MKLRIHTQLSIWGRSIELYIAALGVGDRTLAVAQPLLFVEGPEGEHALPCAKLDIEDAQSLMDSLWHCGLRPSEGSGSAGSLKATENHLADMRKITMGLLKTQGVE